MGNCSRKVLKLGGWSVGKPDAIRKSGDLVHRMLEAGEGPLLVVVSAMKGITDDLIRAAEEVSKGANSEVYVNEIIGRYGETSGILEVDTGYLREMETRLYDGLNPINSPEALNRELLDQVVYLGEFGNVEQVNRYFNKISINSVARHPEDLGAVCNSAYGNAKIDTRYDKLIEERIAEVNADVIVTDGFYYMTEDGKRATIGRGGSDKSAVDYAVRIESPVVMIGGNTNGVMTADPRIVGDDVAFTVQVLCYEEAMACSAHGAKVLHPRAIHPILDRSLKIPIQIFNTFEEDGLTNPEKYTLIKADCEGDSENPIRVINCLDIPKVLTLKSHAMYDADGFNASYFSVLSRYRANPLVTFESYQTNTSLIMNPDIHSDLIRRDLVTLVSEYGGKIVDDTVVFDNDYSLVSLVGEGINLVSGLSGRIGRVFGDNGIKINANASAKNQICMPYLIGDTHAYHAVRLLHKEFFGR